MDFANKWVICRICLKGTSGDMVKIFNNLDMDLVKKIEECGGIKLETANNLPDSICNKCLILLRAASKFREKIQRSQAELIKTFVLQPVPQDQNYEITDESNEFSAAEKTVTDELTQDKATETDMLSLEDNSTRSNAEYSVDYGDMKSEMVGVGTSPARNETPFELLRQNDKLIGYVDQEMEDLELVFNVEDEQNISNFKIVPQFTTKTSNEPRKSSSVKQRKRKSTLNSDPLTESAESNHICPFCGNFYAEKAKLSLHMKIHTKEKPHQCEICLKRFGQTPQLARHMNSHTGSRPFMCKFCSASFADPSTRIKHERIHTNERPYPCSVCGKSFSYSNVLKVHMMTHTGEKPYSCKYCGKQFSQSHHKNKHERLHESTNSKIVKIEDSELIC